MANFLAIEVVILSIQAGASCVSSFCAVRGSTKVAIVSAVLLEKAYALE